MRPLDTSSATIRTLFAILTVEQRRRAAVVITVLSMMLCVSTLVSLYDSLNSALATRLSTAEDLTWMQAQNIMVDLLDTEPLQTKDDRSLITIATDAANDHSITVSRYQPDSKGGLRLWIDRVEYTVAIGWIQDIHRINGLSIDSLTLSALGDLGLVSVNLVLSQ
ncbi:MAG: type II secretion system protein GspM [Pseudomonadota bacterium]